MSSTVVIRVVHKALQSSTFRGVVEWAILKHLAEPHVANEVATSRIDLPAITVAVSKLYKSCFEKRSLKKAEAEQYWIVSIKSILGRKKNAAEVFSPRKRNLMTSPSPDTHVRRYETSPKAFSNFTCSDESDVGRHERRHQERGDRRLRSTRYYRSPTFLASTRNSSLSSLEVPVSVNERYQKTVDYHFYRFIDKSRFYDDEAASWVQNMREKVSVQMTDKAFNGMDCISVINFLTEFKQTCDSSRTHESASVWILQEIMNCPSPAAIKAQFTMSSNDGNSHAGTISTYAEALHHQLNRYASDAVFTKTDDKIHNFRQALLT